MWLVDGVRVIIRAAEFWTSWSLTEGFVREAEKERVAAIHTGGDEVVDKDGGIVDSVVSRMTPRLLTLEEGETLELSMVIEKQFVFDKVDFVPMSRTSVLLLFNLRKL